MTTVHLVAVEATKPSPVKPVAPVTGSVNGSRSEAAVAVTANLLSRPMHHHLSADHPSLPATVPTADQILRTLKDVSDRKRCAFSFSLCSLFQWNNPLFQDHGLTPAVLQQMQQMTAMATATTAPNFSPVSVFNPPRINPLTTPTPPADPRQVRLQTKQIYWQC